MSHGPSTSDNVSIYYNLDFMQWPLDPFGGSHTWPDFSGLHEPWQKPRSILFLYSVMIENEGSASNSRCVPGLLDHSCIGVCVCACSRVTDSETHFPTQLFSNREILQYNSQLKNSQSALLELRPTPKYKCLHSVIFFIDAVK